MARGIRTPRQPVSSVNLQLGKDDGGVAAQSLQLDPQANQGGVVLTAAGRVVIGR
jgi:hypothetical protein